MVWFDKRNGRVGEGRVGEGRVGEGRMGEWEKGDKADCGILYCDFSDL